MSQEDRNKYLYKDVSTNDSKRVDIIKEYVSMVTGINNLSEVSRKRNLADARHIAMYLMSKYTNLTLFEIGEQFGGKDHATVVHAKRKIMNLVNIDKDITNTVNKCMELIELKLK